MRRLFTVIPLTLAACGGSSGSHGDANPGGDGGGVYTGLSTCSNTGPGRAVLVAITPNDIVDLYALFRGKLSPTGIHLNGITAPQDIVMRDDGMEALVAFGGFGRPFGIARIEVDPGATSATVKQVLQVGTDTTPIAIAYADHDHAVLALEAATSEVLGFTRQGSGDFAAGTRTAAPDAFPLQLAALHGSQDVLLSRSQLGTDTTLDIYRLHLQGDGTWKSTGSHGSVPDYPLSMAVNPAGNALYVPTDDPAHPVSATNLDAPGLMHAMGIGPSAFTDGGTIPTPMIGSLLAIDPSGFFLVGEGNLYALDGNGNPNVSSYTWQTVRLKPDGSFDNTYPPTAPKDGLLFDDLDVTANGFLVAMREMYPGRVDPSVEFPLELWAQPTWGAWELCDTEYLSGAAHVAIAP